jgi:hypothetical protein
VPALLGAGLILLGIYQSARTAGQAPVERGTVLGGTD